jgi:hypothetical protein
MVDVVESLRLPDLSDVRKDSSANEILNLGFGHRLLLSEKFQSGTEPERFDD